MAHKSGRIEIIDFLRGHFLIAVFVDHLAIVLGNSIFLFYNWNGDLWISAAEGFVFLSGFSLGYIYLIRKKDTPLHEISKRIFSRVVKLYIISVILSVVYALLFWELPLPQTGLTDYVSQPDLIVIISDALLLKFTYGWAEILPLYVIYLGFTPLILFFMRRKMELLIILVSVILWLLGNTFILTDTRISLFNIFTWQILFVFGIILSSRIERIGAVVKYFASKKSFLAIPMILIFMISIFSIISPGLWVESYNLVDKGDVSVVRLLLFPIWILSFTVIFTVLRKYLPKGVDKVYLLLGRNSLNTYVIQSIVVTLVSLVAFKVGQYASGNFVINSIIVIVLIVVLYFAVKSFTHIMAKRKE